MEISREEILAYTEAQVKTATALEKIADRLGEIAIKQSETFTKVNDYILQDVKTAKESCSANTIALKEIKSDTSYLKILWTVMVGAVMVAIVVIELLHRIIK